MTSYSRIRKPNMTDFLMGLNQAQPAQPLNPANEEDDDLATFTNTTWFDGSGNTREDRIQHENGAMAGINDMSQSLDDLAMPYGLQDDFSPIMGFGSFGDMTSLGDMAPPPFAAPLEHQGGFGTQHGATPAPSQPAHAHQQGPAQATPNGAHPAGPGPRLVPHGAAMLSFEDHAKAGADEDKRRRNTAASARFRVKKKQKEQALEQEAKEMKKQLSTLSARVTELETENRWLRGLLTEKNGGPSEPAPTAAAAAAAASSGSARKACEPGSGGKSEAVASDAGGREKHQGA